MAPESRRNALVAANTGKDGKDSERTKGRAGRLAKRKIDFIRRAVGTCDGSLSGSEINLLFLATVKTGRQLRITEGVP